MVMKASVIFQIIGRPEKFVVESMNDVLERLGKEKGVSILKKEVHEPVEIEDRKNIFSTFAEADIEFQDTNGFFMMMFNYMPANVEIISPSEHKFKANEFNVFVNELLRKLHQYDNLAKAFILEKNNMQRYINELHEKLKSLGIGSEMNLPKPESIDLGEEELGPGKETRRKKKKKVKGRRKRSQKRGN
ncbi:hypothetical protein J4447_05075 [Candidatus Pacearchaeota archaeon]|nr:hypothetical protein [Candidatus Pacearchaeota archaeon]